MALFCTTIRRNLVSLLIFLFLCDVQVFSFKISLVCRLKYPCSCFSSCSFCFLVIIVPLIFMLFVLFLIEVINISFLFLCSFRVLVLMYRHYSQYWRVLFLLFFFLDTHNLSMSFLEFKALCIVVSFLVLWSICLNSSFVHFKIGSRVSHKEGGSGVYPFHKISSIRIGFEKFFVRLRYSFLIFFIFHLHLFDRVSFQYSQVFVSKVKKVKLSPFSWRWLEGSLFSSYYTVV